jgi:hypothetical protein
MIFAEISREQMENKLKDMDELYVDVQSNLDNSKKTILNLKCKLTKAERSNMDLQIQVEKNIKTKNAISLSLFSICSREISANIIFRSASSFVCKAPFIVFSISSFSC